MSHWPVRTGLPSSKKDAEKLKNRLQKYQEVQALILTPDQLEKVVELINCLLAFLSDVPSHEPES